VKWLPFVACYFIPRGRGFFFVFSLSLFCLGASFFGCFQPSWFFQMPLPSFCFVARFMLLGSFFTWVYFLLEPFFSFFSAFAPPPNPLLRLRSRFLLVFALVFFLGPECADLHLHTCTCTWPLRIHFQRFVLKRSLYLPPLCFLPPPPVYVSTVVPQSPPRAVALRTAMRLLPLLLPLHLPPPPLLFMPEPRRRWQRAAALLQPADILGLTHLQRHGRRRRRFGHEV
jgi:hypothetical protein